MTSLYLQRDTVFNKQADLYVHLIQISLQLLIQTNVGNYLLPQFLHV